MEFREQNLRIMIKLQRIFFITFSSVTLVREIQRGISAVFFGSIVEPWALRHSVTLDREILDGEEKTV